MLRLLPILSLLAACGRNTAPESDLDVVPFVDPERYMGLWYEIAAFPIRSQEDCVGATATYSLKDNGDVEVFNQCFQDTLDGKEKSITGKAWIVDAETNAKLKVQFFFPFAADYWVIDLDDEGYEYAVVGHPNREYLWILNREPQMDEVLYEAVLEGITESGYDLAPLVMSVQPEG